MGNATGKPGRSGNVETADEGFLHGLLDAVNDLVWCTSLDGRELLYVNPAAEQIYGRPLAEMIENQDVWREAIHPDDRLTVEQNLNELMDRRRIDQEYRIIRPDGEVRWLRDRITVICDESGEPVRVGGIGTDITARKRAEAALSESEAVFHSLVENLPLNMLRKDADGRVAFGNQRYCETIGRPLEELIGKTDFDLFPAELARKYTEDDRRVIETGEVLHEVEEHRTPDGETIFVEVFKSPVRNSAGENAGVQVMFWDVSERKRVEAELNYERELLQKMMENIPDSIYFKDAESRFVRISRALSERFGLQDPAAAIGKSDADFFTEEHAQQARRDELAIMRSGEPVIGLVEKETWADGRETWVSTTKLPLQDSAGKSIGTFGISRDITTQKQAEENLARANRELEAEIAERRKVENDLARERDLLRTLMDHLPDPISVKDAECRYLMVNTSMMKLLGLESLLQVVGKTDFDLLPQELAERALADDREVLRTGESMIDREERTVDAAGNSLWLLTSKVPLRVGNGNVSGLVSIGRNITGRKRALEQLQAAKEAADKANRAKSDFLANMSHEIRTPMNAVIGMTDLLLDTELDDSQREYVRMLAESGETLLTLINDILDFSKIEAGKFDLDRVAFSLQDTLGDTMKTLSIRAHRKSLELAVHIAPAVPDAIIGDPGRFRQILVNLVGNAIKFTDAGEVVVRVRCVSRTADAVELEFVVSDTGIGIPEHLLKQIFRAFEQADTSTTRRFGGTGLGLAISSRLTELMGGRIWAESTVGAGSTFHFTARFELSDVSIDSTIPSLKKLTGMRVLVVDDNATNRHILEEMLQMRGMEPILAGSAVEALALMRGAERAQDDISLVITDVNMPDIDGFSLVEQIRNDSEFADVVVMVLTSGDRPGDRQRCQELKVASHLLKPIKQSELFDAIVIAFSVTAPEPEAAQPSREELPPVRPLQVLVAEDALPNQLLAV
ncbi:MAG: PAS domain-containing protein, partial [Planctomycetes bacterium]|nr:PAS domain-containing protein [Planctomycetota bacterium]